jgi:hypothetical protein
MAKVYSLSLRKRRRSRSYMLDEATQKRMTISKFKALVVRMFGRRLGGGKFWFRGALYVLR